MMNQVADEGYEGVKFQVDQKGPAMPQACRAAYPAFLASGQRLAEYHLTPNSSGNLSLKVPEGLVITASGSRLARLEMKDLVLVTGCDEGTRTVRCSSGAMPSSETFLHWRVLEEIPAVGALVHVHGDLGLPKRLGMNLPETPQEVPYGSQALTELAAQTVSLSPTGRFIILKNHGFLALGMNLFEAADLLVTLKIQAC